MTIGDLSHLDTPAPFIAMMPQWEFLDFLRDEAAAFPGFPAGDGSAGRRLHRGRRAGRRRAAGGRPRASRAQLTIAADGRSSLVRARHAAGRGRSARRWTSSGSGSPSAGRPRRRAARHRSRRGRMLVLIDRGDYWQCAFLIPKGAAEEYQARGDRLRSASEVAAAAPGARSRRARRASSDLHLLTVELDRLTCWHRPGPAGDRRCRPCHVADRRHRHQPRDPGRGRGRQHPRRAAWRAARTSTRCSHKVQERRLFPTRVIQAGQKAAQDRIIGRVLAAGAPITQAPLAVRLLDRYPAAAADPGPDHRPRRPARAGALARLLRQRSAIAALEVLADRLEELLGGHPRLLGADEDREVLGHLAALDRLDADPLERLGEAHDLGRVVELAAIFEAAGPGEDRGDRVGRGRLALLVHAVVAGDGAVRGLGLDRLAVGSHQDRGHQAERAEALRDQVRLDVAVVILAGPDELAAPLERGGDHVVDQAVLIFDASLRRTCP